MAATGAEVVARLSLALLGLHCGAAAAAGPGAGTGSFCCFAANDATDVCGTCMPVAIAEPGSFCSESRTTCSSCGQGTWCETQNAHVTFDNSWAPHTETRPTPAPTPALLQVTPLPTPAVFDNSWAPSKEALYTTAATPGGCRDAAGAEIERSCHSSSTKHVCETECTKQPNCAGYQAKIFGAGWCCLYTTVAGGLHNPGSGWSLAGSGNNNPLTTTTGKTQYECRLKNQARPTPPPTPVPVQITPLPTPAPVRATPLPTIAPSTLVPNVDAVRQHGRLRVVGNTVVGEHGMPVRLRGMSLFWSQWMGQFWNPDAIRWLKRDWHVSFIRAAMGVENGGYLKNRDREKAKLQAVVDTCIEEGIYVVIDWHDHHADKHAEEAKAFFRDVAQKYGDKPHVLFETFNEPEQTNWTEVIKPYHEHIIPVIREYSDNIIILGTRTWSQEVDVASHKPIFGDNLAYTIHFYAASMGKGLRKQVATALRNGVAVFATEWGTCEYTGDGHLDLEETQAWLDFFEKHHISDSNWAVSDKMESCSALRNGASKSGGWPESQLTPSGAFVRRSIREYNSDAPLPSVISFSQEAVMKAHSVRGALRVAGGGPRSPAAAAVAVLLVGLAAAFAAAACAAGRWGRVPRGRTLLAVDERAADVPGSEAVLSPSSR